MNPRRQAAIADLGAPAVERAVRLLLLLGDAPHGLGVQALAEQTATPRATLYRIVRVLLAHGMLQSAPGQEALYQLGPVMARLGARAPLPRDLVTVAQPVMARLAKTLGETVKLIARDGAEAVTLAVAETELDSRVTSRVGTRVPLHVGSSQRLLLAHAPAEVLRKVLGGPLERRTSRTFADAAALRKSLETLRMTDSVQGHGEGIDGVGAAATLVRGAGDAILGALAVVYIHTGKPVAQLRRFRTEVARAAEEISSWELPAAS